MSDDDVEFISESIPVSPEPINFFGTPGNITRNLSQVYCTLGGSQEKNPNDGVKSEQMAPVIERKTPELIATWSTDSMPENSPVISKVMILQNVQKVESIRCNDIVPSKPHPIVVTQILQTPEMKVGPQNDKIIITQQNVIEAKACKPPAHLGSSPSLAESKVVGGFKMAPKDSQMDANSVVEVKIVSPVKETITSCSPSADESSLSKPIAKLTEDKVAVNVAPQEKGAVSTNPTVSVAILENTNVIATQPSSIPTASPLTCPERPKPPQKRVSFSPKIEIAHLSPEPPKIPKIDPVTITRSGRKVMRKRNDSPVIQRKQRAIYKQDKPLNNRKRKNVQAAVVMLKRLNFPNNEKPPLGTMLDIKTLEKLNNFSVYKKKYRNGHGEDGNITQSKSPPGRKSRQVMSKSMDKSKGSKASVPPHVPTNLPIWKQLDLCKQELKIWESRADALNRQFYIFDAKHTRLKEFLDKLVENRMISKKES